MRLFLLIVALACCGHGAVAQVGPEVMPACRAVLAKSNDQLVVQGVCIGQVRAFMQIQPIMEPNVRSCPPAEVTTEQAIGVVIQYVDEHPNMINERFVTIVILAFRAAWPCK